VLNRWCCWTSPPSCDGSWSRWVVQAEVARSGGDPDGGARDVRLRLHADDLVALDGPRGGGRRRDRAPGATGAGGRAGGPVQRRQSEAEGAAEVDAPRITAIQETWFALDGLRERFHGLTQVAAERVRHLQPEPEEEKDSGHRPGPIDAEARVAAGRGVELGRLVESSREQLSQAETARMAAEIAAAAEERRISEVERVIRPPRGAGTADRSGERRAIAYGGTGCQLIRLTRQITEAREQGRGGEQEFTPSSWMPRGSMRARWT